MRFGEEMNMQAGLENNPEKIESVENMKGVDSVDNLIEGFEISADLEELTKNYEAMFKGVETAELNFFKDVIDNAPVEVREALGAGDTGPLVRYANNLGVAGKRLVGLVVFAAISFSVISFNVSSAHAAGGGAKKVEMFSPASKGAQMNRLEMGGGGSKPLPGGGKFVIDDKGLDDYAKKVAEYNNIKELNNEGGDSRGNSINTGDTIVDGKRI